MARLSRVEEFGPDEIAVVHVMNRVVRRCLLMGTDDYTGKNYDHRKSWVENELKRMAAWFGIDLLTFAIMSNHFHLVLRSRPDVVETWDDTEVAKRWLMLCPNRKAADGRAADPTEPELNSIRLDAEKVKTIRSRLSDISWWMRLLCQKIAQRANKEDEASGKFWQSRYKAVRLIDEEAILACSAYVDLNPIRAAQAETIEDSQFTSARIRLQTMVSTMESSALFDEASSTPNSVCISADSFLSPIEMDEANDPVGVRPSESERRCSDKGFLAMPTAEYFELLDWTAHQIVTGKPGATPMEAPALFERLKIQPDVWCELVKRFGSLFSHVAGQPHHIDDYRSLHRNQRFYVRQAARELLGCAEPLTQSA
jgi:hypothetical protein